MNERRTRKPPATFSSEVIAVIIGVVVGLGVGICIGNDILNKKTLIIGRAGVAKEPESDSITLPSRDALGVTEDGKGFHLGMTLYRVSETSDEMTLEVVETSKDTHSVIVQEKETAQRLNVGEYSSSAKMAIRAKDLVIEQDNHDEQFEVTRPIWLRYHKRNKQLKKLAPPISPVSKE